jgi:hypothetical protein
MPTAKPEAISLLRLFVIFADEIVGAEEGATSLWLTFLLPQKRKPHCIHHDLQVLQLVDERHAPLLQRIVYHGVSGRAGEKDDPVPQVGCDGDQGIVEVQTVDLRHEEIADYGRDITIRRNGIEGLPPARRLPHPEAALLQDLTQGMADSTFVVHQKDCLHDVPA